MAMPPTPAPAPAPAAAGADPTMAGATPPDDMGASDDDAKPPVLFTVLGESGGPYTLIQGDEDDGDEGDADDVGAAASAPGGAPAAGGGDSDEDEGETFDTAPELMKAIMMLLNNEGGAEDSFGKGFRGEDDDTAAKPSGM